VNQRFLFLILRWNMWLATMDTFRTFLASEDHKNQCLEPG